MLHTYKNVFCEYSDFVACQRIFESGDFLSIVSILTLQFLKNIANFEMSFLAFLASNFVVRFVNKQTARYSLTGSH